MKQKYGDILTKEICLEKYVNQNLSITQIANDLTINAVTVYNYLKKFNIPIKKQGSFLIGKKRPDHSKLMTGEGNPLYGKKRAKNICEAISRTRKKRIAEGSIVLARKGKKFPMFSEKMKKLWKKEWFQKKMIKKSRENLNNSPNKIEQDFIKFLKTTGYQQFEFVGNGTFLVEKYNPDFINIKEKQIIELFGNYWHANPLTYKSQDNIINKVLKACDIWKADHLKIKTYYKHGYKVLIIWEYELKDMDKVKEKIYNFTHESFLIIIKDFILNCLNKIIRG